MPMCNFCYSLHNNWQYQEIIKDFYLQQWLMFDCPKISSQGVEEKMQAKFLFPSLVMTRIYLNLLALVDFYQPGVLLDWNWEKLERREGGGGEEHSLL